VLLQILQISLKIIEYGETYEKLCYRNVRNAFI